MKIPDALSTRFLAALQRVHPIQRRTLKDKMLVYESLMPGKTYVIEAGYVRIVSAEASGRYVTRSLFGAGAILGDLPFGLTIFWNEESAVANGTAIVLELDEPVLNELPKPMRIYGRGFWRPMATSCIFLIVGCSGSSPRRCNGGLRWHSLI
ncbi:MAG: hypothetical protein OEU68_10765 [Nitrospira sp.]|jgi:CRP-like cAMP-binding protein|nr:hypothetical protein [Nitrospira sp.]MDH4243381.1 hypothetical protein [Nitrospira sp.]MDH4355799.1 hypothetical protein [Nitrospira sp.]MDH5318032.1 hypothetical protein [Nitrospira sp.]